MICRHVQLLLYCAVVGKAAVVQDSIDDVTSCIIVVILCCSWHGGSATQLMM